MNMRSVSLGGLRCRVVDGGATLPAGSGDPAVRRPAATGGTGAGAHDRDRAPSGRLGVVLCHGYGAPGDDLVSLASEVFHASPRLAERLLFVFPEAPLTLPALGPWESRAWWPLDESVLDAAIAGGAPLDAPRDVPRELPALRETMIRLLDDLERIEGIPISRVILGGFSQGAMLATDVALLLPVAPAGVCSFSGTILDAEEWERRAANRKGLPVLMSHGRQDPLLSFRVAERMRDLLSGAGMDVEFVPFKGPHTIAPETMRALVAFLERLAGG